MTNNNKKKRNCQQGTKNYTTIQRFWKKFDIEKLKTNINKKLALLRRQNLIRKQELKILK